MKSNLFGISALALVGIVALWMPANATTVPPWFNAVTYDYSSSLTLGLTDIDRVFDSNDPVVGGNLISSLGITEGRNYFAWITADQPNRLLLVSWTGFTPGPQGTQFLTWSKIDSDMNSSPLGAFPALLGSVGPNGQLLLAVCSVQDPNCAYQNFSLPSPDVHFTLFLEFQPTPLPAALPLFVTGLGALGLIGWRRKRKAAAVA